VNARRLVVCLIEDNPAARGVVVQTLVRAGFAVTCCSSSDELEGLLLAITPDLFLVDLALPGESGEVIVERLRRRAEFTETPMLAYTAKGQPGDRLEGFDDYLLKPVDLRTLVARVRRAIDRPAGP
jgi:DNA-binding response OmpR family regulator